MEDVQRRHLVQLVMMRDAVLALFMSIKQIVPKIDFVFSSQTRHDYFDFCKDKAKTWHWGTIAAGMTYEGNISHHALL